MEKDFEKVLEIMKYRKELEDKLFEENTNDLRKAIDSNAPTDNTKSSTKEELDKYNETFKTEISEYENYYKILGKMIADEIDALPLNSRSSYIEMTRTTLLKTYEQKMSDIYNKVIESLKDKNYYLDYSKYDELDTGSLYLLEFIKLDKVDKVIEYDNNSSTSKLSVLDIYIINKITQIIDNLPLGSSNIFEKLFKENIISILKLDMQYLMDKIYEFLKYSNYILDYSQYYHEEFKWYRKNRPYLTFIKIDDSVNNYAVKTKKWEKKQKEFDEAIKKNEEETKKYMEEFASLPENEKLKEINKSVSEFSKLVDEFKNQPFFQNNSKNNSISIDETIKRIDEQIAKLKKNNE